MRLLVTADLHLGRRPSRLPTTAAADSRLSPAGAWRDIVETAIHGGADLLVLTGDVVERRNHYFEAIGPLEEGLRRLAAAGIPSYAVAGNHDFDVLPRLAEELPPGALTLLGRHGRWERLRVERGGEAIDLDGWSFSSLREPASPRASYDLARTSDVPVLGLLHCDLDARASPYAPVSSAELRELPPVAWLLGHIHRPGLAGGRGLPLLYPGTPLPLDPGETGIHGPWWVEVDRHGHVELEQVPLAALRYESVAVDLTGAADREAAVLAALRALLRRASEESTDLGWLVARLVLSGTVPAVLKATGRPLESDPLGLSLEHEGARLHIESWLDRTLPELDLAALGRLDDPAGELARILLSLAGDEPDPVLLREARRELERVHDASGFQDVAGDARPDDEETRERLLVAGRRLLAALVAQRPGVVA